MRRRLRTAVTLVSFVLLLVVARWWDRSHYVLDAISTPYKLTLYSHSGRLLLDIRNPRASSWWEWDTYALTSGISRPEAPATAFLGLGVQSRQVKMRGRGVNRYLISVPYWMPMLVAAILPALAVLRLRRRWLAVEKALLKRCVQCGYDLTGNTSGVCPECGERVR